jgi:hypothetical protein
LWCPEPRDNPEPNFFADCCLRKSAPLAVTSILAEKNFGKKKDRTLAPPVGFRIAGAAGLCVANY